MNASETVYVVDDDLSFRVAVTGMLTAAGLNVQGFASGSELLKHLGKEGIPEGSRCVLADVRMPGLDGLQLQQACTDEGVEVPFVFLTRQGDFPSAVSAMRQGAADCLDKCVPAQTLLTSLKRALDRDAQGRSSRVQRQQLERRFAALTERQRRVLEHVVQGKMNKQIGAALGIHERTVKLHRSAIITKLGVRSVAEITTLARQVGLFEEPH